MIIEVAETSLGFDRGEKGNLDAAAGIPDYWIVNLIVEQSEVYRNPGQAAYLDRSIYRGNDAIQPIAISAASLMPSRIFA